jgi:predicted Rdx family selenoprotein
LAAELNDAFGTPAELVGSPSGLFQVEYAGKALFSKKRHGRFPKDTKISDLIKRSAVLKELGKVSAADREDTEN